MRKNWGRINLTSFFTAKFTNYLYSIKIHGTNRKLTLIANRLVNTDTSTTQVYKIRITAYYCELTLRKKENLVISLILIFDH